MTTDLEIRIGDALTAYADLIPDGDTPQLTASSSADRPAAALRWPAMALAAAAVVFAVLTSVVVGNLTNSSPSTQTPAGGRSAVDSSTPNPSTAQDQPTSVDPAYPSDAQSIPDPPEIGVPYTYDLLTHCGIVGITMGDVYFVADPPLVAFPSSAPQGWDNPYQRGNLTFASPDEAVFTDSAGHEVTFRADPSITDPPICD